jgi:glycosyltransferase involved in cell wall biosynthesis
MRIHIIGIPRNPSNTKKPIDSYPMVSYYLTTYLHNAGHEVHYYGYKESTVKCTKKWSCADAKFQKKYYLTEGYEKAIGFNSNETGDKLYIATAYGYLKDNHKPNDIIICMWSPSIYKLSSLFKKANKDVKIIDGHIGHRYPSEHTNYHVYCSQANRSFAYGKSFGESKNKQQNWVDVVIPPMANDLKNFKYKEKKKDYFLFYARLIVNKGLGLYLDLARRFKNEKFLVAGQGILEETLIDGNKVGKIPKNVKFLGLLDLKQRKKYLSDAKAVISPTFYSEPFGLTVIEANLSGTPVITSDKGGYTETVINGYNGFRCAYFSDFVDAINNIKDIKPENCRKNGEKFTAENLIKDWELYLKKVNKKSWYSLD